MLVIESTGQRGRTAIGRGRNSNETVACAASEAFARWRNRRYAPVELPYLFAISFRRAIPCFYKFSASQSVIWIRKYIFVLFCRR